MSYEQVTLEEHSTSILPMSMGAEGLNDGGLIRVGDSCVVVDLERPSDTVDTPEG